MHINCWAISRSCAHFTEVTIHLKSCTIIVMKILFYAIFRQLTNVFHVCSLKSDAHWWKSTPLKHYETLIQTSTVSNLTQPNRWEVANLVFGGVSFHFWIKKGRASFYYVANCRFSEMWTQQILRPKQDSNSQQNRELQHRLRLPPADQRRRWQIRASALSRHRCSCPSHRRPIDRRRRRCCWRTGSLRCPSPCCTLATAGNSGMEAENSFFP